jgi:hypothetical protein
VSDLSEELRIFSNELYEAQRNLNVTDAWKIYEIEPNVAMLVDLLGKAEAFIDKARDRIQELEAQS